MGGEDAGNPSEDRHSSSSSKNSSSSIVHWLRRSQHQLRARVFFFVHSSAHERGGRNRTSQRCCLSRLNSWTCLKSADGHRLKSRRGWSRLVKSVFAPWSNFEVLSRRIRPRASRDVLVKSVGSACWLVVQALLSRFTTTLDIANASCSDDLDA